MATLRVEVSGLRSTKGHVLAGLCSDKSQWLAQGDGTARSATGDPSGGVATCVFADVPPGTYAVALFHDENDNGKLDTNFLRIPKEGFAFSNIAKLGFGPPSFDAAAFEVNDADVTLRTRVTYVLGR